jgi:glycogenin glucosyltransferase
MRGDGYLPGALTLAYALKLQTNIDCICLVTDDVSENARCALRALYEKVISVNELRFHHTVKGGRSDRKTLPTRFQALRLCEGGGLGSVCEKIVLLDADILPLSGYDALFELDAPAGILMENKAGCYSGRKQGSERWSWHRRYEPLCPHGARIPKELTDRVRADASNMGVNAGLWVLIPSADEYNAALNALHDPETQVLARHFPWPEMQTATLLWSGRWTNVDIRYCSIGGYPKPEVLHGIHFAGLKPWQWKHRSIAHYAGFPDFLLWYDFYNTMYLSHAELREVPGLRRLWEFSKGKSSNRRCK